MGRQLLTKTASVKSDYQKSRKTGDSDAPESAAQGTKCQKSTHERGTLTVLERWAFLAKKGFSTTVLATD